ncbi:MAG: hypothetical protein IJF69_04460 [Clostridia bacterium]|nr:hypothetical protein [Clostridia bacterium]
MKRLIALLLLAMIFSGALFSCSKGPEKENGVNSSPFERKNYKGEAFTFLTVKHTQTISDYYGGGFIDSDTYTGNTISNAVYERNLAVEEYYNVKIEELVRISSDPWDVICSYRLAGDICFDAVYGWGYRLCACIPKGSFTDIGDLEGIDLTKSYWAPSALDDLTVNGKLYIASCDISMNRVNWADVIFCNNTVLNDLASENTPESLCIDGKWTYDKYLQLITDAKGLEDTAGLVSKSPGGATLAHGADLYYTKKDTDSITLTIYSDKMQVIMDKAYKLYSDTDAVITDKSVSSKKPLSDGTKDDPWELALQVFCDNKALFCSASANYAPYIKESGVDYTVLPVPKYDEKQDHYNATVTPLASMIAVLPEVRGDRKTASHERTGTVLEYLAFKSEEILYPCYSKNILYSDDNGNTRKTDEELLLIIKNSTRYEFSDLFGISEIPVLVDAMFMRPESAKAACQRQTPKLQQALNEIYESLPTDD